MSDPAHLVDAIMQVMETAFDPTYGEAWNRRQVAEALALPNTNALLIDKNGVPIESANGRVPAGFVLTRKGADEEELLLIAVAPEYRGSGLGRILIELLFSEARSRSTSRIFLEMRRGNPAEHLYRRSGFEPIGERPNYYRTSDGSRIDAITFGRTI
ncbi:GNAT family N-acetyltransferase [Erythrobacter sp. THAF29]|uniref:GNAT family N-acetyltransferase n=1 Tax=Erythrobacter sp. THAF29 TaxID=2587851 RepID=UPI001267FB7D|nr:GNAT family N-acetyltransferase [Erythrobacter sp. THAF29]QFT78328.1 ribosomal-protein-alanine N-acetyltransferase [Erythrobacter sp. THAF29]